MCFKNKLISDMPWILTNSHLPILFLYDSIWASYLTYKYNIQLLENNKGYSATVLSNTSIGI